MDEKEQRSIISLFMPQIRTFMKASEVLLCLSDLPTVVRKRIIEKQKTSSADANELLIQSLMECAEPGWFQSFIDALEAAEFKILASMLKLEKVKDRSCIRRLVESTYTPQFSTVDTVEIMPRLLAKGVINNWDVQEITNIARHDDPLLAFFTLILRLPLRRPDWFKQFYLTLKECKYMVADTLADLLDDPQSDESIDRAVDKFQRINSDELSLHREVSDSSGEIRETSIRYSESACADQNVYGINLDVHNDVAVSSKLPSKSMASQKNIGVVLPAKAESESVVETFVKHISTAPISDSHQSLPGRESPQMLVSLHEDDNDTGTPRNMTNSNVPDIPTTSNNNQLGTADSATSDATLPVDKEYLPNTVHVEGLPSNVDVFELIEYLSLVAEPQIDESGRPSVKIVRDAVTKRATGRAIATFNTPAEAAYVIEVLNGQPFKDRTLSLTIGYRKTGSTRSNAATSRGNEPSSSTELVGAEAVGAVTATDSLSTLVPEDTEELKLRSYQEELAQKAKEGKNCIVVAPTGSGKTHVALGIVQDHFKRLQRRTQQLPIGISPKVVFIVPTVALVEQQKKMFVKYLNSLRTTGLSGNQGEKVPLETLIESYDVFVMTPQIMENTLDLKPEILQCFTLLIFDECHHANKNHPYNAIMSHYIDEVFRFEEQHRPSCSLPQVVGLTASVGVGKAKSMDQAVEHILKLCANLHCSEICTVTKHIKELMSHVNKPNEELKELKGRTNDPFHRIICNIMIQIEERMQSSPYASELTVDQPTSLRAPNDRGTDRYTQWINGLEKPIARIFAQIKRRFFVACQRNLMVYNTALLINADCRTEEAITYIQKQFNPENFERIEIEIADDETDKWLRELYEDKKAELDRVSRDPNNVNPKLEYLKKKILEFYQDNQESRGIIFVKTREMTVALVSWMNETPALKVLNPHNLVGSNAPSQKAGQTQFKQEDVLKCFKEGKHKVIVATSVAEEGLDVQQCNWVIRYEHVTNSIARVQSRGRARAVDAKYCLVAEHGRGVADKETSNKIRENMMQRAIDIIQHEKKPEEIRSKIRQYQKVAKVEREMALKGKQINEQRRAEKNSAGGVAILRCHKCDNYAAHSTDLRLVEGSHRVLVNNQFKDHMIIRPHPHPKKFENFELTGKVYCKECRWEWGVMGVYKSVSFPILKISNLVTEFNQKREKIKQWKDAAFEVKPLSPADLQNMFSSTSANNMSEDDEENDNQDGIFDVLDSEEESTTVSVSVSG